MAQYTITVLHSIANELAGTMIRTGHRENQGNSFLSTPKKNSFFIPDIAKVRVLSKHCSSGSSTWRNPSNSVRKPDRNFYQAIEEESHNFTSPFLRSKSSVGCLKALHLKP